MNFYYINTSLSFFYKFNREQYCSRCKNCLIYLTFISYIRFFLKKIGTNVAENSKKVSIAPELRMLANRHQTVIE